MHTNRAENNHLANIFNEVIEDNQFVDRQSKFKLCEEQDAET
jgi:hypothetical protein